MVVLQLELVRVFLDSQGLVAVRFVDWGCAEGHSVLATASDVRAVVASQGLIGRYAYVWRSLGIEARFRCVISPNAAARIDLGGGTLCEGVVRIVLLVAHAGATYWWVRR